MKADTLLRRLARALILPLLLPLTLAPPARAQAEPANTLALGPDGSANVLVVHASNSLPVFRGVLEDFHRIHPALRLEYTELPTQALYDEIIARRRDATSEKSGRTWSSAAPWTCRPSWPTTATHCPMTRPRPAPCPPGPTGATKSSAPAPIPSSWSTTRAGWTRRARRAPAARCCRCCRRPTGCWPAPCRPMTSAPAPSATWPPPRTRAWTAWRRRCWRRWARTTRRCMPRRTTRWTCWNAATPRWPTTCWSPIPATASNAAPRWPSSTRATTR